MKRKTTQKWFTLLFILSILNTSAENNKEVKRLTNKSTATKTILIVDTIGKPPEGERNRIFN
jgi:hypothetical protein